MASSRKDIWALVSSLEPTTRGAREPDAAETGRQPTPPVVEDRDTFTLLVGSKGAGKTSLCSAYLHRGEDKNSGGGDAADVKPSTGLEYLFVRQNGAVAHMWELASARCVPEMIRVPLAPERILHAACVVVVDLSAPGDALPHLVKWLSTVHTIVGDVLKAKEKHPVDKPLVDRLKRQALDRYGKDHDDREDVCPIAIPVLVVATKFDAFAKEDSARRKPLQQALRFFAHLYGATLLLTSAREKPLIAQMRSVLKVYVFGASSSLHGTKKDVDSVSKPVFVPVGSDSFAEIGLPEGARKEDLLGTPASDVDAKAKPWKRYVDKVFPASGAVTDGWDVDTVSQENEFPEPNVDRARQRKLDELQRIRDAARRKADKPTPKPKPLKTS